MFLVATYSGDAYPVIILTITKVVCFILNQVWNCSCKCHNGT